MPKTDLGSMSLLLLGIGVVLFLSPLSRWWFALEPAWYTTFLAWFGYIVLIAIGIGRERDDL
ncbi:MAG: hypothetical protein RI539_04505 [Spiribacter sp.]|jgi:hypothetical protein|nr:hypothetical protein [Spiribacter sp.]MDR9489590.1 hypothetical protein [Spiribacter sp.]